MSSNNSPIKHYVLKFRFLQEHCPYDQHWCNGKHIPDIDIMGVDNNNIPDKAPCPHYKKNRCKHPERRFHSKGE